MHTPRAPSSDTKTQGIYYGRRRLVPILLVGAALDAYFAVTTSHALTRVVEGALMIWLGMLAYRYWTVPMTPRYAAQAERRARWRTTKVSPKLVLGVLAAVVAFYAALFAAITLGK